MTQRGCKGLTGAPSPLLIVCAYVFAARIKNTYTRTHIDACVSQQTENWKRQPRVWKSKSLETSAGSANIWTNRSPVTAPTQLVFHQTCCSFVPSMRMKNLLHVQFGLFVYLFIYLSRRNYKCSVPRLKYRCHWRNTINKITAHVIGVAKFCLFHCQI